MPQLQQSEREAVPVSKTVEKKEVVRWSVEHGKDTGL